MSQDFDTIDYLVIRGELPEDGPGIYEANRLAFGRSDEAKLVSALRALPEFIPELSLVALEKGIVIGHALLSVVKVEAITGSRDALALGPVAVVPAWQNQGVGSRLIRHAIELARATQYPAIIVLGHKDYYPRFGFTPAHEAGILSPFDVPPEVFMVLEIAQGALTGLSGRVRYPAPFNDV